MYKVKREQYAVYEKVPAHGGQIITAVRVVKFKDCEFGLEICSDVCDVIF